MNQTTANERYKAAGALYRQGRHSEALEILDELVATTPNAAPLHFHRSRCLRALQREAEAITALQRTQASAAVEVQRRGIRSGGDQLVEDGQRLAVAALAIKGASGLVALVRGGLVHAVPGNAM